MAASATYRSSSDSTKQAVLGTKHDFFSEHKLPALSKKRTPLAPLETELKYFVPAELGEKMRKGRERLLIDQHILAKSVVPKLLERLGVSSNVSNCSDLVTARVRRCVASNGSQSFSIEFKSPRFTDVSRYEFSLPISQALYNKLSEEFSRGSVRKVRYIIPGVVMVNGQPEKVKLQLDEVVAAGRRLKALKESFFTADLEVSGERAIADVRKGRHNLNLLSECIELNSQRPGLSKPISSRTLAREGFGAKQLKAVAKLTEQLKRGKRG